MKYFLLFLCTVAWAKPLVVVSVPPYVEFVQKIAGDTVEVETALPPGFDPHSGETTPKHVQALAKATLWIGIGEPFEKRLLSSVQKANPDLKVIDLSKDVPLLMTCGSFDRHIWTSPRLAKQQAQVIGEALGKSPEKYIAELDKLDKVLTTMLESVRGKSIMVTHPSLAYFCKEYGLEELAVECEGKEVRPQDISTLLMEAKRKNVSCFLTQPQFNNQGILLIAEQLGKPPHSIDPLLPDYIENMKLIGQIIARCAT